MSHRTRDLPVLWHLAMSHYNEKVRWALELKRIPHLRRATMPGVHQMVARRLTGGVTFPILVVGGRAIGESSAIVAELERIAPDPPLYPSDPDLRARALELESGFDRVLAPAMRRAMYQEALEDRDFTARFMGVGAPPSRERFYRRAMPAMAPLLRRAFAVPERGDPEPRDVVREQVAVIGEAVSAGGFLVGDSFTVADLAACSFLIPFVDIDAMPTPMPELIEPLAGFGRELAATPGGAWVADTYRRFRVAP